MNILNRMKEKTIRPEFYYSIDFIENLKYFPFYNVIPCSVIFMNEPVGGLLLICKKSDMKYIGLTPPNNPNPYRKFRMMNIDQRIFAIEIHLIFEQDIAVKMHLNPIAKSTNEFFSLCLKSKMMSFHFYDAQSIRLSSTVIEFDDEEIQWFKRNYELIKTLKSNKDYNSICYQLIKAFNSEDILFNFYDNEKVNCFIGENKIVAKF